jgi:cyclopropane fatty-acyl-phospholipid synthase-like methyltransferase
VKEFYEKFYSAVQTSQAYHTFCELVFGQDLCQHGFMDQRQLELIFQVTQLDSTKHVLDLGCGNGKIAEYLSDRSGAHVTGMDYIPLAIHQAQKRTIAKSNRLTFLVGDINKLELPTHAFEVVISIDSIYFSYDYQATIRKLKLTLRDRGQMAFFYSHGREPWVSKESFSCATLPPDQTPLAQALKVNNLTFRTWDLTSQDYELAQRRKTVLAELRSQFEAEGNLFLYENRLGDAKGISQAIEEGMHARYLYQAFPDSLKG